MLVYETASELYATILSKASTISDSAFQTFYTKFLQDAVDYAATRTSWHFMDAAERMEHDKSRTAKHDGYMARLTAVCRNLGIEDLDKILPDRKAKGDFACYIALFLALEQR